MADIQSNHYIHELSQLQDKLYAQNKYSVLIVFQGMDTSGKDSAVKHVFSGVNPAGCNVKSYKVPTAEENKHHFLWRISHHCPETGMIQIFNRSQYEAIIMPMIQNTLSHKNIRQRCQEVNMFEQGLIENNTILLKFYFHISQDEQLKRLRERETNPNKKWKFQEEDVKNINRHKDFEKAYEFVINACSKQAPWYIIPADKKWFKKYLVLKIILETLRKYSIQYPK